MDYYPKTYLSKLFARRRPRRMSMGKNFHGSVYEWLYNLRFVFGGVMIVSSVFLASLIISSLEMEQVHARAADASAKTTPASMFNSPNVVTNGMSQAAHKLEQGVVSTGYAVLSGAHTTATVIANSGIVVARGIQTGVTIAAVGTGKAIATVGKGVGSAVATSAGFVFSIPGNIAGFVSGSSIIESAIRPSSLEEIPIIDPNSPELFAAITALPPEPSVRAANTQDAQGPIWPINGRVTAEFGIPHWPYQPTHTGIDISSGQPAGVTPVKSFRPGTVKDTVHTNRGLGNHVIVDHGSGVTSVYAHLDSIAVHKGQKVDTNTTLGLEGTTGLSTGPHLHFEIRVHGQATNPRQFINGNP
jgi:hypothetical protein